MRNLLPLLVVTLFSLAPPALADLPEVNAALGAGDAAAAVALLKPLAEAGSAEARYRLGVMYSIGHGTEADPGLAVHWLEQAAAAGWRPAALDLSNMYLSGFGVARDEARAKYWMDRAAALAAEQDIEDDC